MAITAKKFNALRLCMILALALLANPALAAGQATGHASAQIVTPISILTFNPFISFGNVVPSNAAGAVTIGVSPGVTRTTAGGATVLPGSFGAAVFYLTGDPNAPVHVTLPASVTINRSGGGPAASMTVDAFTTNPNSPFNLPLAGQILLLGGQLHVAANQPAGTYSGTFNVDVSY